MASLPSKLVDNFGRVINSLRISVTDRCNLRCTYCMPEKVEFMNRTEILSFEEIVRFVRLVVPLGITKLRLTGGEPTIRKDLPKLVEMLAEVEGIQDLGMTTNGIFLDQMAQPLYDAGLHRINISLDTLIKEKFLKITRRDALDRVKDGILAAQRAGFLSIKLNAVAIQGFTDDEILDFAMLARGQKLQIRFIEFMPLDADNLWERKKVLSGREIIDRIHRRFPLEPIQNNKKAPARLYRFKDGKGENIGIIPSVTEPFCEHCNRIRITSDGQLRTCLFSVTETDIRSLIRGGASDEEIATVVVDAVRKKEPGHKINDIDFVQPTRAMFSIGG